MKEIGYSELPMLEVISLNPDADIADSCRRLQQAGFRRCLTGGAMPKSSAPRRGDSFRLRLMLDLLAGRSNFTEPGGRNFTGCR